MCACVWLFSPSQALAGDLMLHCERCMQSAANTHEADTIRQSIVVLMGTLAKHMEKENPKVRERQSCTQAHFLFPLLRRAWVRGWWRIDSHLQLQYSPPSCSVFAGEVCGALVAVQSGHTLTAGKFLGVWSLVT